jgi:hypothetical protein
MTRLGYALIRKSDNAIVKRFDDADDPLRFVHAPAPGTYVGLSPDDHRMVERWLDDPGAPDGYDIMREDESFDGEKVVVARSYSASGE